MYDDSLELMTIYRTCCSGLSRRRGRAGDRLWTRRAGRSSASCSGRGWTTRLWECAAGVCLQRRFSRRVKTFFSLGLQSLRERRCLHCPVWRASAKFGKCLLHQIPRKWRIFINASRLLFRYKSCPSSFPPSFFPLSTSTSRARSSLFSSSGVWRLASINDILDTSISVSLSTLRFDPDHDVAEILAWQHQLGSTVLDALAGLVCLSTSRPYCHTRLNGHTLLVVVVTSRPSTPEPPTVSPRRGHAALAVVMILSSRCWLGVFHSPRYPRTI